MRILKNLIRQNTSSVTEESDLDPIGIVLQNYFEVQKGEIYGLELITQSGKRISIAPESTGDLFNGYGIPPYVSNQGRVSSIYQDEDEHYFIILRESVLMKNGELAYLLMRIDLETMYQLLIKDIRAGEKGYASVKDADGILLMHPKQEDIGTNVMIARKTEFPEYDWSELEYLVNLQKKW